MSAFLVLTACGSAGPTLGPRVPAAPSMPLPATSIAGRVAGGRCARAASAELRAVARRIYRQSVNGRNVTASLRRLTHSAPLSAAVAAGDRARIRRLLPPLVKNQVVRLLITDRAGRVLARKGRTRAFAPQRGVLRDARGATVGHVLIAISGDAALVGIVRRVTGDDVVLVGRGGTRIAATTDATPVPPPGAVTVRYAGRRHRVSSFASRAFPTGVLRVVLLTSPLPAALCAPGGAPAETRMNALAFVARRLYAAEGRSPEVTRSLRHAANDPAVRRAVSESDPQAMRAAIVGLFRNHRFHIVRVRAVDEKSRLIFDLGGPHALAPSFTTIRGPGGRPVGRVELSVQDDTGYIKLMQRFGRVAVILREGARPVPGSTFALGPRALPDAGMTTFRGHRFRVRSFVGPRFPAGGLRVSLLQRAGRRG